jgi:hypothetical protein
MVMNLFRSVIDNCCTANGPTRNRNKFQKARLDTTPDNTRAVLPGGKKPAPAKKNIADNAIELAICYLRDGHVRKTFAAPIRLHQGHPLQQGRQPS